MTPKDFFNKYGPYAIDTQVKYGVPASITLAQAALESDWGESGLTKKANNFFGIKDQAGDEWTGKSINMATGEILNGQSVTVNSNFRFYDSAQESFNDHALFLKKNKRYASLFSIDLSDPYYFIKWANGLKAAGYATATNYAPVLVSLINQYGLTEFDKKAILKKKLIMGLAFSLVIIVIVGTLYLLFKKDK